MRLARNGYYVKKLVVSVKTAACGFDSSENAAASTRPTTWPRCKKRGDFEAVIRALANPPSFWPVRRKIDNVHDTWILKTVRGFGYKLDVS